MITCKSCGTPNEDETYFCEKCGKLLEKDAPPAATSSSAPISAPPVFSSSAPSPINEAKGAYCPKCGAQVAPGSSFCSSCGAHLAAAAIPPSQSHAAPNTASTQTTIPQTATPAAVTQTTNVPSQKIAEFAASPFAVNLNLLAGAAGPLRSGTLEIFTDKVCFTPGKMNVMDPKQTIPMSDITSVELCTVMMLPTGVRITTRGGESFTYFASGGKRDKIAEAIRRQMASPGL
jgi:hypothetical protein